MAGSSITLRLARVAALLFAVSVLGYLAYEAQGRANPPAPAGAQSNAGASGLEHQHGPELPGASGEPIASDVQPIIEDELDGAYLYGSKSGVVVLPEGVGYYDDGQDGIDDPAEGDFYLPSSKVLMLDVSDVPPPLPSGVKVEPGGAKGAVEEAP